MIIERLRRACECSTFVRNYTLAMILVGTLALTAAAVICPPDNYASLFEERSAAESPAYKYPLDKDTRELLKSIFDEQLKVYRSRLDSILTNSRINIIFILVSFWLVSSGSEKFTIPIIGLEMSNRLVLFIIPSFLLYFWVQFGYYLYDAIGSRVSLWHLANAL